jgi:hypothetical protein
MFPEKKAGAGGETRTLMSVTSPDFESGAYTNFATPADVDPGSWSRHIRGRPSNRQPMNADFPSTIPPSKRARGRKMGPPGNVKERLPISIVCYTICKLAQEPAPEPVFRTPLRAQHQNERFPERDSQLF